MKRLKPGQLCTINNYVFQCKKADDKHACIKCAEENGSCLLRRKIIPSCTRIFGLWYYPKLIK